MIESEGNYIQMIENGREIESEVEARERGRTI
jgi:hypothetical protein